MDPTLVYPRPKDKQTVYLRSVVDDPTITVGAYTIYNDFINDPRDFQRNNVLYHYPINGDRLRIGKFCSIACGAKFLFTSGNHARASLANSTFPIFFDEWALDVADIRRAWDNKGDITVGNDVWIGMDAIVMQGVTIGDGAVIGTRALVTHDVAPYTTVAGMPAKALGKRFPDETVRRLLAARWWDWPEERIQERLAAIMSGDVDALCAGVDA